MAVSGNVHVDNTDIGYSDHFLVRMELGMTAKNFKKEKRVIGRWRLEGFDEDEVKLRYQNALKAEVHGFSESVKSKLEGGMRGYDLVNEVLIEWETIVAKSEVGKKKIVCGRAARWWDNEIQGLRRELYKKAVNSRKDLWDEYCRLRKEVKELVREKKLNTWREVVEKANIDFDGSKKEFVSRRTKAKRKKNIPSLKSEAGVSVTSTRGKLDVLQRHYQKLGKLSLDSNFDAEGKEEVESNMSKYGSMSELCEDEFLDKEIEKGEIVKCIDGYNLLWTFALS